jgi:hypothetical protein
LPIQALPHPCSLDRDHDNIEFIYSFVDVSILYLYHTLHTITSQYSHSLYYYYFNSFFRLIFHYLTNFNCQLNRAIFELLDYQKHFSQYATLAEIFFVYFPRFDQTSLFLSCKVLDSRERREERREYFCASEYAHQRCFYLTRYLKVKKEREEEREKREENIFVLVSMLTKENLQITHTDFLGY